MEEVYEFPIEVFNGRASYRDYRRWEGSGRVVN
jgi:hypothetical protein